MAEPVKSDCRPSRHRWNLSYTLDVITRRLCWPSSWMPTMLDSPFLLFFFVLLSQIKSTLWTIRTSVCNRFSIPPNKYINIKWSDQRKNIRYVLTKFESFGCRQMSWRNLFEIEICSPECPTRCRVLPFTFGRKLANGLDLHTKVIPPDLFLFSIFLLIPLSLFSSGLLLGLVVTFQHINNAPMNLSRHVRWRGISCWCFPPPFSMISIKIWSRFFPNCCTTVENHSSSYIFISPTTLASLSVPISCVYTMSLSLRPCVYSCCRQLCSSVYIIQATL